MERYWLGQVPVPARFQYPKMGIHRGMPQRSRGYTHGFLPFRGVLKLSIENLSVGSIQWFAQYGPDHASDDDAADDEGEHR